MVDSKKLMLGNILNCSGSIEKVTTISNDYICINHSNSRTSLSSSYSLPVTKDILTKLGFVRENDGYALYKDKKTKHIGHVFVQFNEGGMLSACEIHTLTKHALFSGCIDSLHELQIAMSLCGFENEAYNFNFNNYESGDN